MAVKCGLSEYESDAIKMDKVSVKETYANLIKWRHAFAHEGRSMTTLEEVIASLPIAEKVILALDHAMDQ